jgi:copper chaperone
MTKTTYTVTGMTCEHCVRAVTAELSTIHGVSSVAIDLPAGAVSVQSVAPLDSGAVRTAVEQAGYQLAAEEPSTGSTTS